MATLRNKKDKWVLVTEYPIKAYPCGARAGDRVRLREDVVIRDHAHKPTGEVRPTGEIWTVLCGAAHEPNVMYLRQPDGERHCWDDGVFLKTFEILPRNRV